MFPGFFLLNCNILILGGLKHMENQNLNILDEVNKGATMGMDAISYVSKKLKIMILNKF